MTADRVTIRASIKIPQRITDALPDGAELWADVSHSGEGLQASAYLPAGLNWSASNCHTLSITYYTNRPAGWQDLLEDMQGGIEECALDDCDVCERYADDE